MPSTNPIVNDARGGIRQPAFWVASTLVVVSDVVTKYLAHTLLQPTYSPRDIVGDTVRLTLVYNPGAAFGMYLGAYSRAVFIALTIGAIFVLFRLLSGTAAPERLRLFALGLVLGGAVGNLINRLWSSRGVVDFLDIGVGNLRWPTFNVADIGVSIGAFLLAWTLWGSERDSNPLAREGQL